MGSLSSTSFWSCYTCLDYRPGNVFDAWELFKDLEEEEETGKLIDAAALADDQFGIKHSFCLDNNSGRDKEELATYPRDRHSWNTYCR